MGLLALLLLEVLTAQPVGVNAANFQPGVSPGSIFSIFGTGFTTGKGQATGYPLPASLAGVSVTVGGKTAPLYYAGPTQINAQVPVDIPANLALLSIDTPNGPVSGGTLVVQATAPGVFSTMPNQPAITNQSGTLNNANAPAAPGSTVSVFVTGIGEVDRPIATGAATPASALFRAKAAVSATIDNVNATIQFAGLAPGFAGLGQVNVTLPAKLSPGIYPLIINVGGVAANTVSLAVR